MNSSEEWSSERQIPTPSGTLTLKALHDRKAMDAIVQLQETIWGYGAPPADYPYPGRCLFEFAESGGLIGAAFYNDLVVGFSAAWLGKDKKLDSYYLHSQLVGVLEEYRNAGVGYHLKLQQRAYAKHINVDLVKWTFDPLKTRNANLNIRKLGAITRTYKADYYGQLQSTFNKGLPTDRFWMEWYVNSPRVGVRIEGTGSSVSNLEPVHANQVSIVDAGFKRMDHYDVDLNDPRLLVEVPENFEELMSQDINLATEWQSGLRAIFTHYLNRGYVVEDLFTSEKDNSRNVFYSLTNRPLGEILAT